jgi:hypothetical protein
VTIPYGSLLVALIMAAAFPVGRWLDRHGAEHVVWARRRFESAAAGISVAYVFVDLLPELGAQHEHFVRAMGAEGLYFAEQRVYVLALISFVVLYGLEHIVLAAREKTKDATGERSSRALYYLQLFGYLGYAFLIGYLVVERAERGAAALAVYGFAMAVHFLIVDHSLEDEHGALYGRAGRWFLSAGPIAGWLIGTLAPVSEVTLARLFAILAGGVVITSLRAELPNERNGRFWPFVLGALIFAAVLLLT